MSVVIVDYGSGNLHSAKKAFERVARETGYAGTVDVSSDPARVLAADRIVLPGVGAFADCRRILATHSASSSDVAAFFEREFAAPLRAALRLGASLAPAPAGLPQSPRVLGLLGAVIWRCIELSDDPMPALRSRVYALSVKHRHQAKTLTENR